MRVNQSAVTPGVQNLAALESHVASRLTFSKLYFAHPSPECLNEAMESTLGRSLV